MAERSHKHSCGTCGGSGEVVCGHCHGQKQFECEKCNGKGRYSSCSKCGSSGEATCPRCGGTGRLDCPVCNYGKVEKTRWINCARCHGTGIRGYDSGGALSCFDCRGRGQVKERYKEICPNCHGDYHDAGGKCSRCNGTGKVVCDRCDGTKHAKCSTCNGTGKVNCHKCDGHGKVKCPECKAREDEIARKRRADQEKALSERRAKEEKERIAKEKSETRQGCGCLLVIIAFICLVIWGPEWFMDTWYGKALFWIRTVVWSIVTTIAALVCAIFQFAWELITK